MSGKFAAHLAVAFALCACSSGSSDCLALPCPLPEAIDVTLTSSSSGAGVTGASIAVSGKIVATVPCDAHCRLPGPAGVYVLRVSAPGYNDVERTVIVRGTNAPCGCPSNTVDQVAIALVPVS